MSDVTSEPVGAETPLKAPRSRSGIALVIVVWLICAAILASLIAGLNLRDIERYSPLLVFFAYGVWLLFWSPSVTVAPSELVVRNLLRTFTIPWAAVRGIDTRLTLTIYTATRKIVAWAAPAPSRRRGGNPNELPNTIQSMGMMRRTRLPPLESGLAAVSIRDYWEQQKEPNRSKDEAASAAPVVTSWLVPEAVILGGLIAISVAAIVLVHS